MSELDLSDVAALIEAAVALGAKVPAPTGSTVWEVSLRPTSTSVWYPVGIFSSFEKAEIFAADRIISMWSDIGYEPWRNKFSADEYAALPTDIMDEHGPLGYAKKIWLEKRTPAEILEWFTANKDKMEDYEYAIEEFQVS